MTFLQKYFYNSSTQNFRHIEVTFVEVGQPLILIITFFVETRVLHY